ncbi:MAG: hypothetical protein ACOVJ5_01740, partial [Gloeomargaritales cyanobacterium]
MTEETTSVQNDTIRDESSAPVRTNFELLSDDTFLNSNYNETTEEAKPTETTKEDASKDEVKDLGLEPETKVEEAKTETTQAKEEVTSETETLDLEPLSLEDN